MSKQANNEPTTEMQSGEGVRGVPFIGRMIGLWYSKQGVKNGRICRTNYR